MKKACSFMMGLLLHYAVFSQVPFSGGYTPPAYADVDTTFNHYVNNIFGLLEPGRVSTGLLADYAFEFTDPRIYNGASLHDSTLVEQGSAGFSWLPTITLCQAPCTTETRRTI